MMTILVFFSLCFANIFSVWVDSLDNQTDCGGGRFIHRDKGIASSDEFDGTRFYPIRNAPRGEYVMCRVTPYFKATRSRTEYQLSTLYFMSTPESCISHNPIVLEPYILCVPSLVNIIDVCQNRTTDGVWVGSTQEWIASCPLGWTSYRVNGWCNPLRCLSVCNEGKPIISKCTGGMYRRWGCPYRSEFTTQDSL